MKLVHKEEEIYELMQAVKQNNSKFLTNFFIDSEKLCYWLQQKKIYFFKSENSVLFFRKSNSFYHLYYAVNSLVQLKALLEQKLIDSKLVTDIVGMQQSIKSIIDLFAEAGFKTHAELHRYVRANETLEVKNNNHYANVIVAGKDDANSIADLLTENFDALSEQIPDFDEVQRLIQDKKIIEVKDGNVVKGFLIRKFNGQTSLLNNFLVEKSFRNQGIGSSLMHYYLDEAKNIKRMILWVLSDNKTAINFYIKYGYKKDNLVDFILTK